MKPLKKSGILSYNVLALLNNSLSSCSSIKLWSWQFQFFCWKSRCRHHQCHLKWTQTISCFDTGRKKRSISHRLHTVLQSVLINLVGRKKKYVKTQIQLNLAMSKSNLISNYSRKQIWSPTLNLVVFHLLYFSYMYLKISCQIGFLNWSIGVIIIKFIWMKCSKCLKSWCENSQSH